MKYFDTKKDSLEEAISKAINENNKPTAKELVDEGGKYLKYSDLLLQKGRLMAKNQSTAMIDKEISKEMKKLGIKEETGDKDKYKEFFQSALKKFGVDSPADFKDDAKKKEFFNYVDKNYKGDHEESVDLEEEDVKIIMDKDVSNRDFQKLMKKFKLKVKETGEYNQGYAEVEISGDKRDMEKMMKVTRDSLSNYKFNSRTKTYESNNLKEYIQADGTRRKVKEGDQRRKENKLNEKDLCIRSSLISKITGIPRVTCIRKIEKLVKLNATGIIATHDLSLTEIESQLEAVKNYYFDAQIVNDELYFDYKLKQGVCQNMNASFLLKKMDIV